MLRRFFSRVSAGWAADELRFIAAASVPLNGAVLLIFAVFRLLGWQNLFSLLIGTVWMLFQYTLLARDLDGAVRKSFDPEGAKRSMTRSYYRRMILAALVMTAGAVTGILNLPVFGLPFFYPKLAFLFRSLFQKKKANTEHPRKGGNLHCQK